MAELQEVKKPKSPKTTAELEAYYEPIQEISQRLDEYQAAPAAPRTRAEQSELDDLIAKNIAARRRISRQRTETTEELIDQTKQLAKVTEKQANLTEQLAGAQDDPVDEEFLARTPAEIAESYEPTSDVTCCLGDIIGELLILILLGLGAILFAIAVYLCVWLISRLFGYRYPIIPKVLQ